MVQTGVAEGVSGEGVKRGGTSVLVGRDHKAYRTWRLVIVSGCGGRGQGPAGGLGSLRRVGADAALPQSMASFLHEILRRGALNQQRVRVREKGGPLHRAAKRERRHRSLRPTGSQAGRTKERASRWFGRAPHPLCESSAAKVAKNGQATGLADGVLYRLQLIEVSHAHPRHGTQDPSATNRRA